MPTLSQIAPFIIAALLAMAALIPGLDAVEKAIIDLKSSRLLNAKEGCYVTVEKVGKGKLDEFETSTQQAACELKEKNIINDNFDPALLYVCKFKLLVGFSAISGATSASVEASAALPSSIEKCSKYEPVIRP